MRIRGLVFIVGLFLLASVASAEPSPTEQLRLLLPDRLGEFQISGTPHAETEQLESASEFAGSAVYVSRGERFSVVIERFRQDADAYSALSLLANKVADNHVEIDSQVGIASTVTLQQVSFVKGRYFVMVTSAKPVKDSKDTLTNLARQLADKLDKGEGDIPVLLKHLPQWEQAQKTAVFLNRFKTLEPFIQNETVLGAIAPEGDADAAIASYGGSRLLLIEFHTPQLAAENDQRIIAKIQELWKLGQRAPTGYRRVGNYSVFVFDAPDEQTAKQLIDQVQYEQVVQWLGENPNILKEAQRRYTETTLGVLVSVLKASGFALIGCFATGGLFGALLFSWRRKQQRALEAFSDAGGMLRLNIDQLTPQTNPARLLRERN